jgi:hypothetical protein
LYLLFKSLKHSSHVKSWGGSMHEYWNFFNDSVVVKVVCNVQVSAYKNYVELIQIRGVNIWNTRRIN